MNRLRTTSRGARWISALFAALAVLLGSAVASPAAHAESPAAVAGSVLSQMDPIGFAKVTVFNAQTGTALRSVITDSEGRYLIGGLPAIGVKVRATKPGYADAWAGGTDKASADVYVLVAGQTLQQSWGEPRALYLDLLPESVVTGQVMGFNDWIVSPYDDPLGDVRIAVFSATTGALLGTGLTDRAGTFRVGALPAGQVKVRATKEGWLTTWATNKSTRASADVFSVGPLMPTDIGTIAMYAPAVLQGQVLSQMDPVGDARVTVFNADTGAALRSVAADGDGNYRVDQLPPGRIKVRATKAGYLTAWANYRDGRMTFENATVFTLVAGQVLTQSWQTEPFGPYLDLMPEAVVAGSVWSVPFGSQSVPVEGATVTVFRAVDSTVIGRATTDREGRYRVGMLPWGDLKIRVSKPGWVTTWAVGKTSMATAEVFRVFPGQTLQQSWGWNFTPVGFDPCAYRPCPAS